METQIPSSDEQNTSLHVCDSEADSTIHAFNDSNINNTVIEKPIDSCEQNTDKIENSLNSKNCQNTEKIETVLILKQCDGAKIAKTDSCLDLKHCEGSDSGVEVVETIDYPRNTSPNRSCNSSIISCCSNYDEAYNLLVRKNSTLFEDYTLRNGDVTSENGSESSSISGNTTRNVKRNILSSGKKKVSVVDAKTKASLAKDRCRTKPLSLPKTSSSQARIKSIDRVQGKTLQTASKPVRKPTPNNLELLPNKPDIKKSSRTSSSSRTPQVTPTDDGRWPSVNSKPAPLMSRSLRGTLEVAQTPPRVKSITQMESKSIEKYATLPRRKKEKPEETPNQKRTNSRESSSNRLSTTKKSSRESTPSKYASLYLSKPKTKTKICYETCVQTTVTMCDLEKAFKGENVSIKGPHDKEMKTVDTQVNMRQKDVEKLQEELKLLSDKYARLNEKHSAQTETLKETENKLKAETLEKEGLRDELNNNSKRVLTILGHESSLNEDDEQNSDSLMVLENRYQNVSQVVIQQEEEISKLHHLCRSLQLDLEKSLTCQKHLFDHQKELETESREIQEFLQDEKAALTEALKEAEMEIKCCKATIAQKDKDIQDKQEECKHLVRQSEQRKQEIQMLQTKMIHVETKSRELLVHQGSSVSGAAVALSALIGRLDGLAGELIAAYNISDQELEDVIYHNEVYNSQTSCSSEDMTPEKSRKCITDKTPSPKKGSSFVSAVINAIKNATAQTTFSKAISKEDLYTEHSSSNEMLDSETEPCLMMEHVLEDVVIPDGHSHNMISSGYGSRLTQSESLKDLSQVYRRQLSDHQTQSMSTSFTSEVDSLTHIFPISLVDQVIDVDNVITRLLKAIRIIQLENDDCMNELQEQRDSLSEQVDKQKESNKIAVQQLIDWEILGSRLKTEVKELLSQLSKKNAEMDNLKSELNNQREQVEKLNQDVCELSTALSKAELEMKIKEEEVAEEIQKWEQTGEVPKAEVLGRLILTQNEITSVKEKLALKEKHLTDLSQEFLESRQVLTESLKNTVHEAKKQYDAIDNALEVLHSIQPVVQQHPALLKLQRELEETNFQSASKMPIAPADFNANAAALVQQVANLEIASPINMIA